MLDILLTTGAGNIYPSACFSIRCNLQGLEDRVLEIEGNV
jgi:hypothetical protein